VEHGPVAPRAEIVLVGVAEIAELLGLSRQRTDQLTRTRDFPLPVERVAPVDETTFEAIRRLFVTLRTKALTYDQVAGALETYSPQLPAHPRIWRLSAVQEWAKEAGRPVHNGKVQGVRPGT
jgi:hypothetical protein